MDSFIIPPTMNSAGSAQNLLARQRMAQAMMQQGMDAAPTTALGALARAVQGGIGGYMFNKAGNDYQSGVRDHYANLAKAMGSGNPSDMAAAMSDGFGNPEIDMRMPDMAHNQAVWAAQGKFANGDPSAFATAFPQQAADLYTKKQLMSINGEAFDRSMGIGSSPQGGPQMSGMPAQSAPQQGQPQPPAFAPLPGSPGQGGGISQSPIPGAQMPGAPSSGMPSGGPQMPPQPPIQNSAQPPQAPQGQGMQFDAQGFPTRPVTDSSQVPIPDAIMRQARTAATNPTGNGVVDGQKVIQDYQNNEMVRLNELYKNGPTGGAIAAGVAGDAKFEGAKADSAASVISNRDTAVKRLQTLNQLANLWQDSGGNITTGPFADRLLKMKQALVGAGFLDGSETAPTEMASKLGTMLATEDAKSLTSRPTQTELKIYMANNPGLMLTPQGNMALIRIKAQLAQRDIDLADAMQNKSYRDLPAVMEQYDKEHPLISPITNKPLDPNAVDFPAAGKEGAPQGGGVREFKWTPDKGLHQ